MSLPASANVQAVDGPERVGSELRWRVRLADGSPGVLAQLLPELARDESIRRRYVRDIERVRSIDARGLAAVVEVGPQPDPRDPSAPPPYRVRADPGGEPLDTWLERRAPAPIPEACELVARLADIVHGIHGHGAVVRDLHPRLVAITETSELWLTDVGLSRVEVLSTRTAASLVLEGSPYASPEQLARTTIDGRSDLYGLGVILFRALTGALPFGDEPALLRDPDAPVLGPAKLRPEVPAAINAVVHRCLQTEPSRRPESARELAEILRGKTPGGALELSRVNCQSCGVALRPGQRLCHSCGNLAVTFEHVGEGLGYSVVLKKVQEDAEYLAKLRGFMGSVADGVMPRLNFLVGDARMYSKEERKRLIQLPVPVLSHLTEASATGVKDRLARLGITTHLVHPKAQIKAASRGSYAILGVFGLATAMFLGLAAITGSAALVVIATISIALGIGLSYGYARSRQWKKKGKPPLVRLRAAAAALPASDPLVRRLADLLNDDTKADVREQVGELALLVQRLVDHRMRNTGERAEIDVVTAPAARLVDLVARQVAAIRKVDADLARLDEGTMVRSLAAAEARGEPPAARQEILEGLDRLRGLEDERAHAFHRLLEASALLRRSIELGLSVHDEAAAHERQVALALAALGD